MMTCFLADKAMTRTVALSATPLGLLPRGVKNFLEMFRIEADYHDDQTRLHPCFVRRPCRWFD